MFITSILLITYGINAKETNPSSGVERVVGLVMLSESKISSKWMEKFTPVKNISPEKKAISTCCFGCPEPIAIERKPIHICLPLDYATIIVTKTKGKFSIENKGEINHLYVPENSNNLWFNAI